MARSADAIDVQKDRPADVDAGLHMTDHEHYSLVGPLLHARSISTYSRSYYLVSVLHWIAVVDVVHVEYGRVLLNSF